MNPKHDAANAASTFADAAITRVDAPRSDAFRTGPHSEVVPL